MFFLIFLLLLSEALGYYTVSYVRLCGFSSVQGLSLHASHFLLRLVLPTAFSTGCDLRMCALLFWGGVYMRNRVLVGVLVGTLPPLSD